MGSQLVYSLYMVQYFLFFYNSTILGTCHHFGEVPKLNVPWHQCQYQQWQHEQ